MATATLIVFARRPHAGKVKRRLARSMGGRGAAQVYAGLLARTLRASRRSGYSRLLLMPASPGDCAWFRARCARHGWLIRAQVRGDLGRRMAHALGAELARGRSAVLIGSDIADLQCADLRAARRELAAGAEAVLGPASDGGYWLIGLTLPVAGLFDDMPWSTSAVAALTCERLADAGRRLAVLAVRHDIDEARDLRQPGISARACARVRAARSFVR